MPKKSAKEAAAIKKLDDSALEAQERITKAADKAQKMIGEACTVATTALEQASRVPDRRNLNGSYNWDRGDRRGSNDRLERLEARMDEVTKTCGDLEIGQATRETQIKELISDVRDIKKDLPSLRDRFEQAHAELSRRVDANISAVSLKFDSLADKFDKFQLSNKTWLIGIMFTVIMSMLFIIGSRFIP